jgi:hypothetical protein
MNSIRRIADLKRLEHSIIQQMLARKAASTITPIDDYVPCELNATQTQDLEFRESQSGPTDISTALEEVGSRDIGISAREFDKALSRSVHSPSPIRRAINDLADQGKIKPWSGQSIDDAKNEATTVIAGIHVQEVHNDQPVLTAIDCKGANGVIDLSKTDAVERLSPAPSMDKPREDQPHPSQECSGDDVFVVTGVNKTELPTTLTFSNRS